MKKGWKRKTEQSSNNIQQNPTTPPTDDQSKSSLKIQISHQSESSLKIKERTKNSAELYET